MANDEKMVARDEETLPADSDVPSLDDSLAGPLGKAAAKEDDKARFGKTLPFPGTKGPQASMRLEDSFGMPDFGFFADPAPSEPPVRESIRESMSFPDMMPPAREEAKPAAVAEQEPEAEPTGVMPLHEGTGWDSVGSIVKPSSLRARIEMQDSEHDVGEVTIGQLFAADEEPAEDANDAEKSAGQRHEANVTPFPGTVLHMHSERTPADMLRGGAKSSDVFDDLAARAGEEKAPAEADEASNPDALADAVQSALRNIYGSYSEPQPDPGELGGYTVADALAGPDPSMEEPVWAEERTAPVEWAQQGPRGRDYEADQPSAEAAAGEPALDYFFNQRRQERAAPQLSPEMSLNEYAARSALEEKWEPEQEPEDDRRVMPFPGRDRADSYRGREPAVGEASIIRTGGFFSDDARRPVEPEWGQQPYSAPQNARGTITPTYAPTVTASTDQMPGQAPDSGHLLGAAGLGLIGGIALAGVLAVFVFNSFVDESGQSVSGGAGKTEERLASAQTTANPIEVRVPETRAVEPVRQIAPAAEPARQPSSAAEPPAAAPAPANAASEPRRSAALSPSQTAPVAPPLPSPDVGGGARLVASSVSGPADTPIRLNIVIADGDPGEALVSLKGLPRGARLSTEGIDVGGGQRLLPPSGLKDLTITVPAGSEGTYRMEAQLLKDSAQTSVSEPVPFTLTIVAVTAGAGRAVQPVANAAPRPGGTQAGLLPDEAPLPETDFLTTVLIKDGNKLMREGDIAAAQRTYEKAAASGNPEAFLALGRSYDPTYFEKLNVKTGRPDPAKAFDSYKKALDGGVLGARNKIDSLKQWLQR